ncbi:F-box/FBD/LRR-repeat protein [Senna tora]|uniref:F-box/FBD/LRR-repeat protein n=1 Tax=Senna tora TaxID=362788 RepID=A0A834X423_9FABA|nr:F-box/FBD/LRR-repeat protein [Senna tora]
MSDRISELPDHLLCKILCYLPNTKQAATTFFLSKRWKSVWLQLTSLYLDDEDYINHIVTPVRRNFKTNYYSRFAQFVNGVLSVNQPSIQRFRLRCVVTHPRPSHFTTWLNTALQGNLQELDISLSCGRGTLPTHVFTCTNLVVLKLRGITIQDEIDSVCLPSLRILCLKCVEFSSEYCLVKLLSPSSSTLENLLLSNVCNGPSYSYRGHYVLQLVEYWMCDAGKKGVVICLRGVELILDHVLAGNPTFHNLITLDISFLATLKWNDVMHVIQNSPKLQNLLIQKKYKLLGGEVDSWDEPQDNVPGCVSSHLRTCCLQNHVPGESDSHRHLVSLLPFAKYIIENAGFLQIMTICVPTPTQRIRQWMNQELSSCPRKSPTCKINLQPHKYLSPD